MILVFVGAGGSAAVDREQYPTTVEFFNRLPDGITRNNLFAQVREFLEAQKGGEPIDIEEVLWNLDELRDYLQASRDPEAVAGWMMSGNRISQLIGGPDLSPFLRGLPGLEDRIQNLKSEINTQVYQFYAKAPDPKKLRDWIQLLRGLAESDSNIEIFTTNYDRVLERVIGEAEINVEIGLKPNPDQMALDMTLWDSSGQPLNNNRGRLTKLHGSVNWQRSAEGIVASNPIFTGDHQNHSILYPGYKGEPDQEPFIKFHEHLRAVVQKANIAIFVGFAFRDDYINDILSALPPEIPTYVINRDESLPSLPFTNAYKHFNEGFTAGAATACLESLQPSLGMTIADYDKAIELHPQNAIFYRNRGIAKRALGDPEAEEDLAKAIEIDPSLEKYESEDHP